MSGITNHVVFITGPARGIGAAVARGLAARGARLALAGLEPEKLAALATDLGSPHIWMECDVSDQESLERAVRQTVDTLGGIDVVVANAGIASHGTVFTTPIKALTRVIDVNLTGVVRTVSATLAHVVARKGYIFLMSSASALATSPGLAVYAATKIGVEHFGNCLRVELAHKGVSVGSAHPCWVDTDLVRDFDHDMTTFRKMLRTLPGPFGKISSVEDTAAAIIDGIAKRKRKVFVPRSLGPIAAVRQLLMSPLSDAFYRRNAKRLLTEMEEETASRGVSFGEHSVERQKG